MKVMAINAGSSSLKFKLFEMNGEQVIASGLFERIGIEDSFYTIKYNGESIREEIDLPDQVVTAKVLMDKLIALEIITSMDEIKGISHRVVSGGEKYNDSVLITDEVIEVVDGLKDLAPLHIPASLKVIRAFKEVLPDTPMVAVFDTTFHQTVEKKNYIYPVPYDWYEKYGVRKYGYHGTSYRYVASELEKELGKKDYKAIVCHIGSGASICAIKDGKSYDTSMGFSPASGIMMNTRAGDIDQSIITYIMEKEGKNAMEVMDDLNRVSGFLGVSGLSSDSRDVIKGMEEGNERCRLAVDIFTRRVLAYISEYYVALGGIDAIVFTGGVGENQISTRKRIIDKLSCLGIELDEDKNNIPNNGENRKISSDASSADVYVIPTDEELVMARDAIRIAANR